MTGATGMETHFGQLSQSDDCCYWKAAE